MKHHFTVERVVTIPRYRTRTLPGGEKVREREGDYRATRFIVELDPERLVEHLGELALRRRRGTAKLHGGAIKVIALVTCAERAPDALPSTALA